MDLTVEQDYRIQSQDSTFIFGSVARGDAQLRVNGHPVPVYPTGGWIAWLKLPDDSVAQFEIVATAGSETATLLLSAPIARRYEPPDSVVWIDTTSFHPTGDRWIRRDEGLELVVRAVPGARVYGVLGGGRTIEFLPDTSAGKIPLGERVFGTRVEAVEQLPAPTDRYVTWWSGRLGPDPDLVLAPNFPALAADTQWMRVLAVVGADSAWARWPLRLGLVDSQVPTVVVLDDDLRGTGTSDGIVVGRPSPYGTYHWFFPNKTIGVVSGRWNDQVRLRLSQSSEAWVSLNEVYPLPPGTPPARGTVASVRIAPGTSSVVFRIPLPGRIPFRVEEWERELRVTLYGVAADVDWIQYGGTDSLIRLVSFAQPAVDETNVTVSLSRDVWGYRTRWDGTDLLLELRRPPQIDPGRPLAGRVIALDPGHPPLGARGPTGTWEPDIVLGVARKAAELLERYGARVVLTREDEQPVGLMHRPAIAEAAGAEVLVSIHANALPDGVNPFDNNGTSVYYFHPRSAPLARELNRSLVRQFGFRDLGMGRGNLALVRSQWMPSALTEGLFLMIPEQEAVLASDVGQWRYARGIVEGVAAFLRQRGLNEN
ncbi:MAG: N-acetylmuramoyl-L-alanine amidase [Gemmatimonadota bacterium]|nr:MAG: N-acetylmuramoyl-L-alanine amidase [Gemmatimonadota bacterium]